MRVEKNSGIIVGPGGHIEGGAVVNNATHKEVHHMKNTFNAPVGAVGETITGLNVVQNNAGGPPVDLNALALELSRVRAEADRLASDQGHRASVDALEQAESAAKDGNEQSALTYLSKAGSWALEVATKIGTSLAVEVLKRALN